MLSRRASTRGSCSSRWVQGHCCSLITAPWLRSNAVFTPVSLPALPEMLVHPAQKPGTKVCVRETCCVAANTPETVACRGVPAPAGLSNRNVMVDARVLLRSHCRTLITQQCCFHSCFVTFVLPGTQRMFLPAAQRPAHKAIRKGNMLRCCKHTRVHTRVSVHVQSHCACEKSVASSRGVKSKRAAAFARQHLGCAVTLL